MDMLTLFNEFLYSAPDYATEKDWGGLIAFPFNVVINWPMATPAGVALFTSHKVNVMLKKMFDVWAVFLTGKKSQYVLNTKTGWLSEEALETLKVPSYDNSQKLDFVDAYECDLTKDYYGFKSWDDFFVRDFKKDVRPVEDLDNNNVIVSACESDVYRIANNVKEMDKFWLKGQPYSLYHMLAGDPDYAKSFKGGIVFQAFLSARSYHRWHSPVKGKIKKIVFVSGTYYAASPNVQDDPAATDKSQPYITQLATRVLIFIQAHNEKIGLMCFIGVGMSEVSTCQVTVQEHDLVEKGEEIGMFHFGGSTHCLVFRKETKLKFVYNEGKLPYDPDPDAQPAALLSRKIATVI
jgi:phosphatidylserine decarboxylase